MDNVKSLSACVLASGSKGNSTLVEGNKTKILILVQNNVKIFCFFGVLKGNFTEDITLLDQSCYDNSSADCRIEKNGNS